MRCKSCNNLIDYEVRNTLTGHRHNNTGQYEELCRGCLKIAKQAAYNCYQDHSTQEGTVNVNDSLEDYEAVYQGFSDTGFTTRDYD